MSFTRDETLLASVGVDADASHGAVMPPINLSANYSFAGYDQKRVYDYSRSGNPTRDLLGEALAGLERGARAVVTSSGLSAIDLVLNLFSQGGLVIAPHDCYGGSWRLFEARARQGLIRVIYVDQTDPIAVGQALALQPQLFWIETPSNPLMRIADIAQLARLAKAAGAKVAVDNTFLSPLLQKPIELGADFSVHSTTKYLNGHSDVVGGAVIAAGEEDAAELRWWANATGVTGAPFDAWLTLRGLRTLSVRLERQQASAHHIAHQLARHPNVCAVHYPGLESHPGYRLARKQQSGFGAMLSFELSGGVGAARSFLERLTCFTLAESLGGVESLAAHPATMTHAAMSAEARAQAGIGDGLIRLSFGLEHVEDLWSALRAALQWASHAHNGAPAKAGADA